MVYTYATAGDFVRGADLALTLFNLALIVTSVGLAYRYVTSSTARVYARTLKEMLGPWADKLLSSPLTSDLRLRGPFQFTNIRPPRMQLPMSRDELIAAFERVAPGLYGEALAILGRQMPHDDEWKRQSEGEWSKFIERLKKEPKGSYEAHEIVTISERYGDREFHLIRRALWQLFPDVNDLISRYEEFLRKIDHANRRRNFRQLTVIAGLMTLSGNLTLNRLANLDALQPGSVLFDLHIVKGLPGMLLHREFGAVLNYIAGCLLPTLTIAGVADVLDHKLFGTAMTDFLGPRDRKSGEPIVENKDR
jgi:hypothetical protein